MKFWIVAALCAAVASLAGYQVELRRIPSAIMTRTEGVIANAAGGFNAMRHAALPDHTSRNVVRPSPDQFYSACAYDLQRGPVVFEGAVPEDTYWSLSFFAHNTDNYFVANDRDLAGEAFRFVLVAKGDAAPEGVGEPQIVRSPSRTGVVLQRIFVDSWEKAAALDAQRKKTACRPWDGPAPLDKE